MFSYVAIVCSRNIKIYSIFAVTRIAIMIYRSAINYVSEEEGIIVLNHCQINDTSVTQIAHVNGICYSC